MAIPNVGRGTWIGWGKETTFGTAVARTHWAQAVSADLIRKVQIETLPHLVHGDDAVIQDTYASREEAGGNVELVMRYGQLGYLLEAAMGTAATTGGPTYTHTFSSNPLLPSLTIEQILGDSANSEVFEGCKVNDFELSCEVGGYMKAKFGIMGETAAAIGAKGTPAAPAEAVILHRHAGAMTHNSVSYTISSASVALKNGMDRLQELGSMFTSDAPVGFREWAVKARIAYRSDALYSLHLAETAASGSLAFTSGAVSLTFAWANALIRAYGRPFSSAGVVYQDVEIMPRSSGSTDALTIALVNANANYYD